MRKFTDCDLSEVERLISFYERFVESARDGYDMCIHEYTNDLSCREQLEYCRETPSVRAVWTRVVAADAAFREILLPTSRPIYGDPPKAHFWFWGYPANSPELQADLKALDAI